MRPVAHAASGPVLTTTCAVRFDKRKRTCARPVKAAPFGRIPRVTRLLALAHRIDGLIRDGEIWDWAEAARLAGITRARMTQIANLLLLAPEIQAVLLELPVVLRGRDSLTERGLRGALTQVEWTHQARSAAHFTGQSALPHRQQ